MNKQIVCGDIGGTKTILQLAEIKDKKISEQLTHRYDSQAFANFSDILGDFLNTAGASSCPAAACFAIAGPIVAQQAKLTNLSWRIDSADIANEFSIAQVKLINDFAAAALAIDNLRSDDLATLQAGQAHAQAMRVVLGAGTGMGVAWLGWMEGRYFAFPTEAGHMEFAPVNPLQIRLLETLQDKFGHVSVERLLSGSGLTNIFNFLQTQHEESSDLAIIHLEEDSGARISALAQKNHPIAIQSLNLFAEIYGAYAGNLALAGLCRGGVYIAGGIAPRILNILNSGGFMQAFRDKGRFAALMNEIPVHIVTNREISLLGAKQEAYYLLNEGLPRLSLRSH